jgi:hypothetical protein
MNIEQLKIIVETLNLLAVLVVVVIIARMIMKALSGRTETEEQLRRLIEVLNEDQITISKYDHEMAITLAINAIRQIRAEKK